MQKSILFFNISSHDNCFYLNIVPSQELKLMGKSLNFEFWSVYRANKSRFERDKTSLSSKRLLRDQWEVVFSSLQILRRQSTNAGGIDKAKEMRCKER